MHVIVAEDEPLARERLVKLIRQSPGFSVTAECANGPEALRAVRDQEADILLLDVQMPDLTGVQVIEALMRDLPAEQIPVVVFVTAYDEYAIRAFEYHAADYLLKPYTTNRLAGALAHARERVLARQIRGTSARLMELLQSLRAADPTGDTQLEGGVKFLDRLAVRDRRGLVVIAASDIDRVEGAGVYVEIHTSSGHYVLRETLTTLQNRLNPARFLRVHRSTIVNLDRVRMLEPLSNGAFDLVLEDGTRVRSSRRYRESILAALEQIG